MNHDEIIKAYDRRIKDYEDQIKKLEKLKAKVLLDKIYMKAKRNHVLEKTKRDL